MVKEKQKDKFQDNEMTKKDGRDLVDYIGK